MAKPEARTLGTPGQSGQPRISHDPLSINELLIWERMDTNRNDFVRPQYLDPYPGFVDPATQVTLYANYQCVNIRELDRQFIEVCYRLLPSQIYYSWITYSDLQAKLPDVLTGITASFNSSRGDGTSSHPASQQAAEITNAGSVAENPRGKAQASASILPEAQWTFAPLWAKDIPTFNYAFQMAGNVQLVDILARVTAIMAGITSEQTGLKLIPATVVTVTVATPGVISWTAHGLANGRAVMFTTTGALPTGLLPNTIYFVVNAATNSFQVAHTIGGTAINTTGTQSGVHSGLPAVNPMPLFKPVTITLSAFGGQASVAVDAETNAYYSRNDDGSSQSLGFDWGNGFSQDNSVSNRTYQIPASLHAGITIAGASATSGVATATIDASSEAIVQGSTVIVAAITNTLTQQTEAAGQIFPSVIAATTPADIPRTGLYLTELDSNIHGDQLLLVHVGVIDFSFFA